MPEDQDIIALHGIKLIKVCKGNPLIFEVECELKPIWHSERWVKL